MLTLMDRHEVRYQIIGGMAFIFHAKPRYTKDMNLWIDPEPENVQRANRALAEFGSPLLLEADDLDAIVQIGVAPDRIDLLLQVGKLAFARAWERRVRGRYGESKANWIDLESLLEIKSDIDQPKHQEDARVLREVWERRKGKSE